MLGELALRLLAAAMSVVAERSVRLTVWLGEAADRRKAKRHAH